MTRLLVSGPSITRAEIDAVTDAAATSWGENANRYVARFERAFAELHGVRHAVALPSCTSAIHLALAAHGIGPGDEVVVPELTWIASAAPVHYVGATPVFADVSPSTWCLDADSFSRCVTARTRAVIPVDLYGCMPDFDELRAVAEPRGIVVIEDAAEAIGSTYHGRRSGTLGDIGVFSFHGSKTLTTGEGGMLITPSDSVASRVRSLRDHGRVPGDPAFWNREVAFKYKMSELQAALGWAQLSRFDELVAMKRAIFGWYREELADAVGVTLNPELPDRFHAVWMVTALVDAKLGCDKTAVATALDAQDIDTRPFFHPLSSLPAYADASDAPRARRENAVARSLSPWGINLPSGLGMTRDDVHRVCRALRQSLGL